MKDCKPLRCPTLKDLPEPPAGRTGWPWTEESPQLADTMSDGREWPVLSVIVCSWRQGKYIEETIRSILLQGYPKLQFIIMDGASDDNTVEIIEKYDKWISFWHSEPDKGQSDAINKAFKKVTGDVVAWQNSDDIYYANAFRRAIELLWPSPVLDAVYGSTVSTDPESKITSTLEEAYESAFNLADMIPWPNLHNEALFIRRSVLPDDHLVDGSWKRCMDIELFYRLAKQGVKFHHLGEIFAGRRIHPEAKGSTDIKVVTEEFRALFVDMAKNPDLGEDVHKKAIWCLQMFANRDWKAHNFTMMRDNLEALSELGGPTAIPIKLRAKALLSHFMKEVEPLTRKELN